MLPSTCANVDYVLNLNVQRCYIVLVLFVQLIFKDSLLNDLQRSTTAFKQAHPPEPSRQKVRSPTADKEVKKFLLGMCSCLGFWHDVK